MNPDQGNNDPGLSLKMSMMSFQPNPKEGYRERSLQPKVRGFNLSQLKY
jgi:hypothetical protein